MPRLVFVFRNDDARDISVADLREKLSDELDMPCNTEGREWDKRIVFEGIGISVALIPDENARLTAGLLEIADRVHQEQVGRVLRAFRELGWAF